MSIAVLEARDGSITLEERGPDQVATALDLPFTRISAEALRAILEKGNLRALSLSGAHFPASDLTEADVNALEDVSALRDLFVNGAHLPADLLHQLASLMGRLNALDASGCKLDPNAIWRIAAAISARFFRSG